MLKSRVLIVDDEADIRELLSLTLQRMGLDTDCAAGEFEATQFMQKPVTICASPTCVCRTAMDCESSSTLSRRRWSAGCGDHRVRQRRKRRRRAQGRRLRLPRQAGGARAIARARQAGAQSAGAARRGKRTTKIEVSNYPELLGDSARDAAGAQDDRPARARARRRSSSMANRAAARSSRRG